MLLFLKSVDILANNCWHIYFGSVYIRRKQTPIPSTIFFRGNMLMLYGNKNLSATSHMIVVTQSLCFSTNELRRGSFKVAY